MVRDQGPKRKSGCMSGTPGSVASIPRPAAAAVPGVGLTRATAAGPTFTGRVEPKHTVLT